MVTMNFLMYISTVNDINEYEGLTIFLTHVAHFKLCFMAIWKDLK